GLADLEGGPTQAWPGDGSKRSRRRRALQRRSGARSARLLGRLSPEGREAVLVASLVTRRLHAAPHRPGASAGAPTGLLRSVEFDRGQGRVPRDPAARGLRAHARLVGGGRVARSRLALDLGSLLPALRRRERQAFRVLDRAGRD